MNLRNRIDRITKDKLMQALAKDPYLAPFTEVIRARLIKIEERVHQLTDRHLSLTDFASAHEFFGLHQKSGEWIFREWAPNATAVFLIGEFSQWQAADRFALKKISSEGIWEIRLPASTLCHHDLFRLQVHWPGGQGDRIPVYARRIHQDPDTLIFNAEVWCPADAFVWKHTAPTPPIAPLIYEAHVGMAMEKAGIGTYDEFTRYVLPRIVAAGYNTLQLMAIQHHPYYGSFGYHVSSFFAPSARFGTPDALKRLIDAAHGLGLRVLIDLVHSHAVINEVEGLSRFDGSEYQYFHQGNRGYHRAWDSRCFDYSKPPVLHMLLSNCRFWLDEYHIDGFRMDGITSMLYTHHGLEKVFASYEDYFDDSVDIDAMAYLFMANKLIHSLRPDAITIAEDVSGMPGLAAPLDTGGLGFDFRFAMGIPDYWIKLIKNYRDEDWPMGELWFELTNRRSDEQTISYAESHDQALVGDQSLFFRLTGSAIYEHMRIEDIHSDIDRAMALHKMIRLITITTAGHGYLNFMGNEFGHPEWIDFPRAGNQWSYQYARRQWSLVDDPDLKYRQLNLFDKKMIELIETQGLLATSPPVLIHEHNDHNVLAFTRAGLVFVFNFHPTISHVHYSISAPVSHYRIVLDSDDCAFGGHGRLQTDKNHYCLPTADQQLNTLKLYLPTRTAIVLSPVP